MTAVVLLAGCAGAPGSRLTSADTPTPRPTKTADPASRVAKVIVGPESVEAQNEDGVVIRSFGFDDDPAAVVASLTTSLGVEPRVTDSAGGEATDADVPGSTYDWAGLELVVPDYATTAVGDGSSDYRLEVTQPTVNEIAVQTSSDIGVGRSASEVRTIADRYSSPSRPATAKRIPLESWSRASSSGETWTDWIAVDLADNTVTRIIATFHDYGA